MSSSESDTPNDYRERVEANRKKNWNILKEMLGNTKEELEEAFKEMKKEGAKKSARKKSHQNRSSNWAVQLDTPRRSSRKSYAADYTDPAPGCSGWDSETEKKPVWTKRSKPVRKSTARATVPESAGVLGFDDNLRCITDSRSVEVQRSSFYLDPIFVDKWHIDRIASNSKKTYDKETGSTCHQCRQKTQDLKSVCHNEDCFGVRGQFCGVCLFNHYGVRVVKTWLNTFWVCPVCRGICHCSICFESNPLGQIVPIIRRTGFKSVHHFLVNRGVFGKEDLYTDSEDELSDNDKKDKKKKNSEGLTENEMFFLEKLPVPNQSIQSGQQDKPVANKGKITKVKARAAIAISGPSAVKNLSEVYELKTCDSTNVDIECTKSIATVDEFSAEKREKNSDGMKVNANMLKLGDSDEIQHSKDTSSVVRQLLGGKENSFEYCENYDTGKYSGHIFGNDKHKIKGFIKSLVVMDAIDRQRVKLFFGQDTVFDYSCRLIIQRSLRNPHKLDESCDSEDDVENNFIGFDNQSVVNTDRGSSAKENYNEDSRCGELTVADWMYLQTIFQEPKKLRFFLEQDEPLSTTTETCDMVKQVPFKTNNVKEIPVQKV